MAMASAAAAVSSSAAFVVPGSRISPASTTTSISYRTVQVRCSQVEEKARPVSRREVFSFAALSAALLMTSERAEAKDIPLFGIRKKVEQAEKAVEKEVKELEKEGSALLKAGEKELAKDVEGVEKAVSGAIGEIESVSPSAISPALQAGGVIGAELVAVAVASSVVNGLIGALNE
ncbi:hypothetical protein R1flu_015270 [Riccia fluitans]|uniref:Synechocystis YCF37 n=1 Tax=Riccia fluitans TaxID=41844 RepID=A0ABD1YJK0_9MARC